MTISVDKLAVDKLAVDKLAVDKLAVDKLAVDNLATANNLPSSRAGDGTSTCGGDAFTTTYLIVVNSLTETLYREVAQSRGELNELEDDARRREVCAAVWTTVQAALRASLLSPGQQQFVLNALSSRLSSYWQENRWSHNSVAAEIRARASVYLRHIDSRDPVSSALGIVELLLEATAMPAGATQSRTLAALIAHRITSDVWLFNDWESQGKLAFAREIAQVAR
jgi:hypothetical protein